MKCIFCVLAVLVFCISSCCASVTLKGGDQPIGSVVQAICKDTPIQCEFDPQVDQQVLVPSFSIVDTPVDSALKYVLRLVRMSCEFADNKCKISNSTLSPVQPASASVSSTSSQRTPVVGMSKYEVTALLGKAEAESDGTPGNETWFYHDWIVTFRSARVSEAEPAGSARLVFTSSNKPVPYLDMINAQRENARQQAAAQRRDAAERLRQHFEKPQIVMLTGTAEDIAIERKYANYPNTVFVRPR